VRYGRRSFILSFITAPIALYIVFVISPYVQAFYMALTDWQGYSPSMNFVGAANFTRLSHDSMFWLALRHNLYLVIAITATVVALALFFASMMNFGGSGAGHGGRSAIRGVRGSRFYQIVYFFPSVLSVTVVAVMWQFIYDPKNGLLNGFLSAIGLDSLQEVWLGDHNTALWAIAVVAIWGSVGFYVVLFTASMGSIPHELYEAALLDGATRLQTFWRLTVPLIWDSIQVAIIYLIIGALDTFALVQVMSIGPGGPDNSTQVIALYLFNNAFSYSKFGYASAIGVTMFVMTLLCTVVALRFSRRDRVEY